MGGEREFQGDGYIQLCLIHVDVWQKQTQHGKASILQVKLKKKKKRN